VYYKYEKIGHPLQVVMVAIAHCIAHLTVAASASDCTYTPTFDDINGGGSYGTSYNFNYPFLTPGVDHTVIMTMVDDDDNSAEACISKVTVKDETKPVITCPSVIPQFIADSSCSNSSLLQWTVPAKDNCDFSVSFATFSDTIQGIGTFSYNFRATDTSGNVADTKCSTTLVDETPPMLTCPDPFELESDPACMNTSPYLRINNTDNCPGKV
jgi:hypothetical protein